MNNNAALRVFIGKGLGGFDDPEFEESLLDKAQKQQDLVEFVIVIKMNNNAAFRVFISKGE
jgi:hypothetical protein